MAATKNQIAISAPVTITAAEAAGENKGPARFTALFYSGGAMEIEGWELPVAIDLAGLKNGKVLVANLDHDRTKRVGNFAVDNDGKQLVANGTATAKTAARDEVIGSAAEGYQWQASLEVNPEAIEEIKAGQAVTVNGQTLQGPLYVTRSGTLKGFAFVSHGADDKTNVTIAATAAKPKPEYKKMKAEISQWAATMGIDVDAATPELCATIEANYNGQHRAGDPSVNASNPFEKRKAEAKRRKEINAHAEKFMRDRDSDEEEIIADEQMVTHAIEAGSNPRDFRADLYDTVYPLATAPQHKQRETQVTDNVLTAAVCQAGRLRGIEDHFSDQELQIAHTIFKGRIGLKQLICFCAAAKGYNAGNFTVDLETQRAAFATNDRRQQHGSGFSTLSIANVLAATANKYLHEGWMAIDQTAMRLANVVSVSDFKQITTVSLMGDLQYLKVGADGEIKHGDLQDLTYTNQIDTYARMLQITRKDIINDDLGALTAVPKRLGRGAALKLNDIFWTEFLGLVAAGFFAAGNNNLNAGVATMTLEGLAATETIFLNQTDPDGKPLGIMPKIILVPPALRPAAAAILYPQANMAGTAGQNNNIFAGRYTLESSPYVSNSSYTGYTSVGWWMLADPDELPVIQIAALNGRVEPTVETADADFNVLGVQFRGYSDVGVNEQEKRGGVYADGGAS